MGDRVVRAMNATQDRDEAHDNDNGEAWAGVTDASLRRRLQNRLNQRESSTPRFISATFDQLSMY